MTDRQALLSAAGKQRPYKAVNIKPPAMPGDIYLVRLFLLKIFLMLPFCLAAIFLVFVAIFFVSAYNEL